VRTVNTKRSAKQFARGHRGGILDECIEVVHPHVIDRLVGRRAVPVLSLEVDAVPPPDDGGRVASVPRLLPRLGELGVFVEIGEDDATFAVFRSDPTPTWAAAGGVGGEVSAGRRPRCAPWCGRR
jgi:hypothetical protein